MLGQMRSSRGRCSVLARRRILVRAVVRLLEFQWAGVRVVESRRQWLPHWTCHGHRVQPVPVPCGCAALHVV